MHSHNFSHPKIVSQIHIPMAKFGPILRSLHGKFPADPVQSERFEFLPPSFKLMYNILYFNT